MIYCIRYCGGKIIVCELNRVVFVLEKKQPNMSLIGSDDTEQSHVREGLSTCLQGNKSIVSSLVPYDLGAGQDDH